MTHMVGNNKSLKEVYSSCGGNYGSNEIDKKIFEDIIDPIFGYKNFEQLLEKYKRLNMNEDKEIIFDYWCELERQIKDFKEGTNMEKIKSKEKFPVNCSLFQDFFDDDYNIDITDLINKYNSLQFDENLKLNIKSKKRWIIEFPYQIIYNYIKNQSNLICKSIREILNSPNITIDSLIFVGGYCSNSIITSLIKDGLKRFIRNFLQPSKPSLAIMEGAVLFGINPNIIDIRISKYTIGQGIKKSWDEEKYSKLGKKVYDEDTKRWFCEDCFDKFIEIKQKLSIEQEITKPYITLEPRFCGLTFYKSLNPNPIYTFENGVEKIGYLEVDAGKDYSVGERDIKVTVKFGGTFINVRAIHMKSGKEVKSTLNFY